MSILESRAAEMAHHQHGWLSRDPAATIATMSDLANRLSAASAAVGVQASPDPLPDLAARLASRPGPSGELGGYFAWKAMDVLAPRLIDLESRVGVIDHISAPDASTDPLQAIAAEIKLDGFGHRREERFFKALGRLITGTLAIEARIGALASPKPAAK